MSEEKDITDFVDKVNMFKVPSKYESYLINMEQNLSERSILYLEFLAGAFLQETGLKASEAELVCTYRPTLNGVEIVWNFRKKE